MTLRNVLTMLAAALVTASLTIAILAPRAAVQAGPTIQPAIAHPQLTAQGCTFTLTTDKPAYEAGQTPKIEVKAVNPTNTAVTVSAWVTVASTSPASRMSRMLPIPRLLWSHEYAFQLGPDESKSLTADCAALPAGANVAITLADSNNAVLMGNLGIPAGVNGQVVGGPNAVAPPAANKN